MPFHYPHHSKLQYLDYSEIHLASNFDDLGNQAIELSIGSRSLYFLAKHFGPESSGFTGFPLRRTPCFFGFEFDLVETTDSAWTNPAFGRFDDLVMMRQEPTFCQSKLVSQISLSFFCFLDGIFLTFQSNCCKSSCLPFHLLPALGYQRDLLTYIQP